jgi:probable HAF family extracellular repeat protein
MKKIYRFRVFALILGSALSICLGSITSARAQERSYLIDLNSKTVTEIGTLGGDYIRATGINDLGQVVGLSSTSAGGYHAFITGPNGKGMRDLGSLGGRNSEARSINDAGQVVGISDTAASASHAFITGADGMSMRDLMASKLISSAADINDKGQVVGWFVAEIAPGDRPDMGWHAFITGPNGVGEGYF